METIIINLTEKEENLIKRHLNGTWDGMLATPEEQQIFTGLLDKAEALQDKLNAIDEVMDCPNSDIIYWYYKKYQEQGK